MENVLPKCSWQKHRNCGYCITAGLKTNTAHPNLHYVTKVKDSLLSCESCRRRNRDISQVTPPPFRVRAGPCRTYIFVFVIKFYVVLFAFIRVLRFRLKPAHIAFLHVLKNQLNHSLLSPAPSVASLNFLGVQVLILH
jgi:hypothetical protein